MGIDAEVTILNNYAALSGGGVYIEEVETV